MKTNLFLSLQKSMVVLMLLFCKLSLFAQSQDSLLAQPRDTIIAATTSDKAFKMHFVIGVNIMRCSLNTKSGYDQVIRYGVLPYNHYMVFESYRINSIKSQLSPGLTIGLSGEFRLNNRWTFIINPSFCLGSTVIVYNVLCYNQQGQVVYNQNIQGGYMSYNWAEMALLIKYAFGGQNKYYLLGGFSPRLSIDMYNWYSKSSRLSIAPFDMSVALGGGVKVYKDICVQLKLNIGLINVLNSRDGFWGEPLESIFWGEPLESIRNNYLQLGFVF